MTVRIYSLAGAAALAAAIALGPSPAAASGEAKPLSDLFHGKLVKITKKGEIELFYDFEESVQLMDFEISLPFRAINTATRELERGKVRFKGTGSLRHRAVFSDWVEASGKFAPLKAQDFGFAITEERESEVFTLYCCYDRYFGLGDGVTVPQNMVIKFLARDPEINRDGYQDWRYCGSRGQKPEIKRGATYDVSVRRKGMKSEFHIGDWTSKGREAGRELTSQMVAVYGYDTDVKFDDLTIRGILSPTFVAQHGIDLEAAAKVFEEASAPLPEEPVEPELPVDEVERIRARIAGYPRTTKYPALAKMLRDTEIPVSLREEAVAEALERADKRVVPFLVDGLYDADLAARRLSFDVVKGLLGKTFGYRADAPETNRAKGIKSLNDYIRRRQKDFQ